MSILADFFSKVCRIRLSHSLLIVEESNSKRDTLNKQKAKPPPKLLKQLGYHEIWPATLSIWASKNLEMGKELLRFDYRQAYGNWKYDKKTTGGLSVGIDFLDVRPSEHGDFVDSLFPLLTERQQDICNMLMDGYSQESIAETLEWSVRTIRYDIEDIRETIEEVQQKADELYPDGLDRHQRIAGAAAKTRAEARGKRARAAYKQAQRQARLADRLPQEKMRIRSGSAIAGLADRSEALGRLPVRPDSGPARQTPPRGGERGTPE